VILGDCISVRVMSGSGKARPELGRKSPGNFRNRHAAQKFFHR
jgi:hypothetical protein